MQEIDVLARYREWLQKPTTATMNALLAEITQQGISFNDDCAQVLRDKHSAITPATYYFLTAVRAALNTIAALSVGGPHAHAQRTTRTLCG